VAGGFRVGSAWVDGDGIAAIPDPKRPRRRRGVLLSLAPSLAPAAGSVRLAEGDRTDRTRVGGRVRPGGPL